MMARGIVCHDIEFKNIDFDGYEHIFLIKTSSIDFHECHDDSNKVKYIDLSTYFMKTHKQTRHLNKILLKKNHDSMFISLLKSSDRVFFEYVRLIVVLQELSSTFKFTDIDIIVDNKKLLIEILEMTNIAFNFHLHTLGKERFNLKEMLIVRFLYRVSKLNKYLYFFIREYKTMNNFKVILTPYYSAQSYQYLAHFDYKDALVYPLISDHDQYSSFHKDIYNLQEKKFLTFNWYKKFFFKSYTNFIRLKKMSIPPAIRDVLSKRVVDLEFYNVLYQSAVDIYKPEMFVGQFDATSYIDYITEELNTVGVQTICIPHGINFKYKVNYISHGVNSYVFWSKEHKKQFDENVLVQNCDNDEIGGFSGFKDMKKRYLKEKANFSNNQKSILLIGEYFSKDTFYTSPFNYETAKRLFEKLKGYALSLKVPITVRTRLNDDYHHLALEYESYGIKISTPEKKEIFSEIMEHDLIVSVFSNALHESLLLRKKTLQVNFLGIENYRNLAERGLVYYARDEDELDMFMKRYMEDDLDILDFALHEEEYCNSGKQYKDTEG